MTFFVGSTNPVKIEAVKRASQWKWQDLVVVGYETTSGVSEQPMNDEETRLGATNRARAALKTGQAESQQPGETYLGVGLEGGVFANSQGELWSTVWVVVADSQGKLYEANGGRIKVPHIIAEKIKAGGEMGPVVQAITGFADVKKRQGMFGVITDNYVSRTEEYSSIAKIAIGVWFGRHWDRQLTNR